MLRDLRFFFKDSLIAYPLGIAALATIAQIIVLAAGISPRREPLSLHYTSYLGVDFIGAWYLVYLIPLASLCVAVINGGGAYLLKRRDALLPYLLTVGAAIVAALLLTQVVLLVRLNS